VAAVVCIDAAVVGRWAEEHHIPYTSYPELSQKPEVRALIAEAVGQVNKGLPPAARIRRFVNLHKEFDADDEELTRTRKLRRAYLEERYRDVVEGLYSGPGEIGLDTAITYEDGRVARSKTTLRVVEAQGA
jgi:long-chain acyl-CoA synthetase